MNPTNSAFERARRDLIQPAELLNREPTALESLNLQSQGKVRLDQEDSEHGWDDKQSVSIQDRRSRPRIALRNVDHSLPSAGAAIPLGKLSSAGPAVSMASTEPAGLTTWPTEAFTKYRKIAKLQDRYFTDQTRLKSERDVAKAISHKLQESRNQFMELLKPNIKKAGITKRRNAAYTRLLTDQESFDKQTEVVNELEQLLSKLEYRLAKLQPELLELFDAYYQTRPRSDSPVSGLGSDSRPISPPLDPIADEYYAARGQVRLLRDRLFNDGTELAPDVAREGVVLSDRVGEELEVKQSDLDDHTGRAADKQANRRDLQQAEKRLTELWHACQEAALDVGQLSEELSAMPAPFEAQDADEPENQEIIELSSPPFLPQNRFGLVRRFLQEFSWPERGTLVPPMSEGAANFADKWDFINQWVGRVSFGQGSAGVPDLQYSPVDHFEHRVATPKSDPDWLSVQRISDGVSSDRDYVLVTENSKIAPNGEPLEFGGVRRVLRRWRSDTLLRERYQHGGRGAHRASHDIQHTTGLVPP